MSIQTKQSSSPSKEDASQQIVAKEAADSRQEAAKAPSLSHMDQSHLASQQDSISLLDSSNHRTPYDQRNVQY